MLPRKLHLEQVNRFHDTVEKLSKVIDAETDVEKRGNLSMIYFELTARMWAEIDNFIEYNIKDVLDRLDTTKPWTNFKREN